MHKKITRRAFCSMLLALPFPVWAQQPPKMARLGYLGFAFPSTNPNRREALLQGLRDLGYVEGKNITIDYRWGEGKAEFLPNLAAELVGLKPDVIFVGSPQPTLVLKKATTTIPVVFVGIGDPVEIGVVASLARPGGNITGLANMSSELSGKRLGLLKESAPKTSSVAVFLNGGNQGVPNLWQDLEDTARALKLKLYRLDVRSAEDLDIAFRAATKARANALMPLPDPFINSQMKRIIEFAAKNRLPAIYAGSEFVDADGLMAYGPNIADQFRRAAVFIDKILKGTKPADLPVERPMRFEFVINLKTADQIGLTIPQWTLMKADKVIR
jgi:putative ABC transport system substrate-binding protein